MSALPMTLNTTAESETAKIARGLRERDMELLADLVERCQHRLVRYLLYLTGRREYAEDLAQETWIRVLQRGSQYNGRQRFDPWLFAIARNLAIDYLRKKQNAVGVGHQTLLRWLYAGKVAEPERMILGGASIRLWTKADIKRA